MLHKKEKNMNENENNKREGFIKYLFKQIKETNELFFEFILPMIIASMFAISLIIFIIFILCVILLISSFLLTTFFFGDQKHNYIDLLYTCSFLSLTFITIFIPSYLTTIFLKWKEIDIMGKIFN